MLGGLQGMRSGPFTSARGTHVAFGALLILVLLWPALLNGLPLFFPDSGGYLMVAWGDYWLTDRSSFYGAYLKPFAMPWGIPGLWLALIPQLTAIALLLVATAKRLEATFWPWPLLLLAATTGPWHAAQLMPDAFAVPTILLGWILASRAPSAPGSPLLWLAAAIVCLTHSTFPALLVASVVATLLVLWFGGLAFRDVGARLAALGVTLFFTVGVQLAANTAFIHTTTYAPRSSAFLYASLNEDGLIEPWLEKHCSDNARIRDLCAIAPGFPRDSQQLLWSPDSVFFKTVWAQRGNRPGVDWDRQLGIATRGALLQSPAAFVAAAADATVEQFFSYRVLDDECPGVCRNPRSALQGALGEFRPSLQQRINDSPQMEGRLNSYPLQAVTGLLSTLGLLALFACLPLALRRRDTVAASLLLAILAALLANAFVTGTLSDVHDRYQSRVVWLAPVACLLVLLRWRAMRLRRPGPAPR